MNDLIEAKNNLIAALGEDLKVQYFALLKEWFLFKESLTKIQFDSAVRKLCKTEEQLHCHNTFFLALLIKVQSPRVKTARAPTDKSSFELADYMDYVQPASPALNPQNYTERTAVSEFFLPDSSFVAMKVEVHAWENGLDGADEDVPELVVSLCQMFVKNILTAMITKKESYKIRDGNFQYGFGFPVADPLIRNTHNMRDYMQESKVDVLDDEDTFVPCYRPTLEKVEQEAAFAYACGRRSYSGDKLTVKLLYDTLRENPNIVGMHSIHSTNLVKIGLQLEDP